MLCELEAIQTEVSFSLIKRCALRRHLHSCVELHRQGTLEIKSIPPEGRAQGAGGGALGGPGGGGLIDCGGAPSGGGDPLVDTGRGDTLSGVGGGDPLAGVGGGGEGREIAAG